MNCHICNFLNPDKACNHYLKESIGSENSFQYLVNIESLDNQIILGILKSFDYLHAETEFTRLFMGFHCKKHETLGYTTKKVVIKKVFFDTKKTELICTGYINDEYFYTLKNKK